MAIFDPKTNLRIGVKILKESIDSTGSLVEGLRLYKAGEDSVSQETEYIARVLAEQSRLQEAINPALPQAASAAQSSKKLPAKPSQ